MSSPPDPSEVLRGLSHLNVETYINVCAVVVLLYDYLLTLHYEVKYIWPSKWSLTKVLFLCTRYPAFIDTSLVIWLQFGHNLSPNVCTTLYDLIGWLIMFGIAVAECIIILRTVALWGGQRSIKYSLLAIFTLTFIAASVALGKFQSTTRFIPTESLGNFSTGKGCLVGKASVDVIGTYISFTVFDTVIVTLTMIKAVRLRRLSRSSLVETLYRDGMLYYVTLFLFSFVSVVIILAVASDLMLLLLGFQRSLYSILSGRILLHIHRAREKEPFDIKLPHRRERAGSSTAFQVDSIRRGIEMDSFDEHGHDR